MTAKRKRESSVAETPNPITAPFKSRPTLDLKSKSTTSDHDRGNVDNGNGDEGPKGPKVQYIAAEGSNFWSKSLDLERDYAKSLKHIGKKLGISKGDTDKLRLSHVRDGGREVEIYDDFDYQAFKARAVASPGSQLVLKVYGVPMVAGSSKEEKYKADSGNKAQKGKGKRRESGAQASAVQYKAKESKRPSAHSTTVSNSPTSTTNGQSSSHKPKTNQSRPPKPSQIPPQVGSATSNSPSSNTSSATPSPSTKKTKRAEKNKDKKLKSMSETPATPSPAPSTPSPFKGARPTAALHFHDRYKPARPSPLNPNRVVAIQVAAPSPAPSIDTEGPNPKRRNRRRKQQLARKSDANSDTSGIDTPHSTPQKEGERSESPSIGEKEGSVDKSPPRKRARGSAKQPEQPKKSSPAPVTLTSPNISTSTAASSSIPPIEQPSDATAADEAPSSKKVIRVSNENYDLKQKPIESKAVSSSINGGKAKRSRKSTASSSVSSSTSEVDTPPAESTITPELPAPTAEPPSTSVPTSAPGAKAPASSSAVLPLEFVVSSSELPTTPASKKGKSKAAPKAKSTPAVSDELHSTPEATTSSQNQQASSSPPPSSDPSNSGTPSKRKKAAKPKKAESSEPGMMQQILARQRERVAAEKAAKAALEAGNVTSEATVDARPSANGKVDDAEAIAPVIEATTAPLREEVSTSGTFDKETGPIPASSPVAANATEPAAPTAVADEPVLSDAAIEEEPTAPAEANPTTETPAVNEPAPPIPASDVNEAAPSSENLFPSSLKSATSPGGPEKDEAHDIEMLDPTPDAEPELDTEAVASAPAEEEQPAAVELLTTEPEVDVDQSASDAQSQAQPTTFDELVSETVIPATNATSATSSSSKGKPTKGKPRKVEVPCMICLRTPWHIQKDCPEVKAGPANLRYLLSARQDQHDSISTEDDESHFDTSIEAIQEWIERLEMISGKVQGLVKKDAFKPRSPVKVMGNKEGLRLDLNAVEPKKVGKRKSVDPAELDDDLNGSTIQVPETTEIPAAALTNGHEPSQASQQSAQSPPESRPESPMAVPDTYNFPPIHLRAMQKSRRPGSLSGLSVSDAIIETEPSDDSSSEDEQDDGDEVNNSDTSSVVSDTTDSDSESDSDSDGSGSTGSRVVMPSDPSDAMKFSLTRDLSEREKKKARLSAAKMQPVSFDLESVVDDEDNDNLAISPPKPVSRPMMRSRSDSSIEEFGDGDSRRSSIDSNATAPYRSQAPPVIASSALPARSSSIASDLESIEDPPESSAVLDATANADEAINQDTASTIVPAEESSVESEEEIAPVEVSSGQRSRSFRELEGMAASSPDLDDSAGLEAVRQGIEEDEDDNDSVHSQKESASLPVATQSLSQARRTRSSASVVADSHENVIVPASQPLRRSSRSSISATSQPQDLPRRLRSVSRDVAEKTPPPPARSTRSRSQSQVPMSPSTPKARRVSRTMVSDAEEETPKQTPRRTRVTRSTQPEELLPTVDASQSSQLPVERQTQPTPVRRSTRASPSPLFMSQGSQLPATQFYNAQPETIPLESSSQPSSQTNGHGRKTRNGRKAASPIPEEREDEDQDGDINMSPKSASGSLPPPQSETEEHPTSGQADPADYEDVEMADAESRASSSDNENENDAHVDDEDDLNSIPDIQPPKPRILPPASSQSTTPIYPSLSSLPKELLRKSWNMLSGNTPSTPVSARQALTNGHSANGSGNGHTNEDSDDSGSSSDSSVEAAQAPPSVLKGRFASGGMKKKPRSSQVAGW